MKVLLKASLTACLFSCVLNSFSQEAPLSKAQSIAYQNIWELKTPEETQAISPFDIYIRSLHLSIHHILSNNPSSVDDYEKGIAQLENHIKELPKSRETLFVLSEISLHYAFVQLKFDNTITAGWAIRKSFKQTEKALKEYPEYIPLLKTAGLLNVIVGSVPKKYEWLVSLVGLNGSIDQGINQLQTLSNSNNIFLKQESQALLALLNAYLNLNIEYTYRLKSETNLAYLVQALINSKAGNNEMALSQLAKLEPFNSTYPIVAYLAAEANLRAQRQSEARYYYLKFLASNTGESNVKDAYFKIALSYHLNENKDSAEYYLEKAKESGVEKTAADRHAAKVISTSRLPNAGLLKLRLLTDGGYYTDAQQIIDSIRPHMLKGFNDQLEFQYRSARLFHKNGQPETAIDYYQEVINQSPMKGYYYAPNSCLQLGYIFANQNKTETARGYFEKVKDYTKHEYKSSLDQKAKAALSKLQ